MSPFEGAPMGDPQEKEIDPQTGLVMNPEEIEEMRENNDRNNP